MPFPGRICLLATFFVLVMASILPAQVVPGSRYVSFAYGELEGEFSIAARLSGQFRKDMGIEVMMGFVPSRGDSSDIYSLVHYRYHLWPGKRIVPHLVGGGGAIIVMGGGERYTEFVMSMGGGVAAYLTENIALRFDVENFAVFLEGTTDNRQSLGAGFILIF